MPKNRLAALAVGIGLVAAACGTADRDEDAAAPSDEETAIVEPGTEPTAEPTGGAAVEGDLRSPTTVDRPFDLDGGVQSGQNEDAVTIVSDDPRGALVSDVATATEPWTTDWTRQTVDVSEIFLGIARIDPRDAIPPIDEPTFEPIADAAAWLSDNQPGALVQFNGEVRFYPLSILTRHELVNDRFGDIPVAVSYCPLCNTALTFDRRVDGQVLRFGVSGLLRKSDLVMWDDVTLSLWQQITGEAIVGELAGTQLALIPTAIVSFADARADFPDAVSLSPDTGFGIPYGFNPYEGYSSRSAPIGAFFKDEIDPRFRALERVVGLSGGAGKAYPFSIISTELVVNDEVDDVPIAVFWGGTTADALDTGLIELGTKIGTGIAFDRRVDGQVLTFASAGEDLFRDLETGTTWTLLGLAVEGELAGARLEVVPHRNEFWFAWSGFFPDAPVYEGA